MSTGLFFLHFEHFDFWFIVSCNLICMGYTRITNWVCARGNHKVVRSILVTNEGFSNSSMKINSSNKVFSMSLPGN